MTLKELATEIKSCSIWSLTYEGSLYGFRVKSYDVQSGNYVYYDFDTDVVENIPDYLGFFKDKCKNFKRLSLKLVDGRLYTQEELDGKYEARELLTKEETAHILKPVILLYRGGVLSV